jgi:hypothetical protein
MITPYVVEGYLDLAVQEGGFAADEFNLDPLVPTTVRPYHAPWCREGKTTEYQLSEAVAQHFDAERRRGGNRYIGKVRVTIERLEE